MTGPEHYATAEQLLAEVDDTPFANSQQLWRECRSLLAEAQVHATLALAAATMEQSAYARGDVDKLDWHEVLS